MIFLTFLAPIATTNTKPRKNVSSKARIHFKGNVKLSTIGLRSFLLFCVQMRSYIPTNML